MSRLIRHHACPGCGSATRVDHAGMADRINCAWCGETSLLPITQQRQDERPAPLRTVTLSLAPISFFHGIERR